MRWEVPKTRYEEEEWSDDSPVAAAVPQEADDLTIGQISSEFGVTLRTLRFYESRGLIAPRRDGATRHYGRAERDRIEIVLKLKKLGFTLLEIRQLIDAQERARGVGDGEGVVLSRRQCVEQINLLERQKRDIENALAELRRTYSSHYTRFLSGAAEH